MGSVAGSVANLDLATLAWVGSAGGKERRGVLLVELGRIWDRYGSHTTSGIMRSVQDW